MNKLVKNTFLAASACMMFTACVHDDDYGLPPLNCNDRWEANTDISTVKEWNNTDTPFEVTTESVLEGYVVSSDETGNIYKSISIQDSPENPTAGMTIEVDLSNTYTRYPVGSRVLVDLNGLYVAKDRGTYKVGTTFDSNGVVRVGRMPEATVLSHVSLSCQDAEEIVPVSYSTIAEAMDESHLNTLIKLENVQFQSAGNGETYYQDEGAFGGAFNRTIVDSEGNTIDLRTSSYADFAAEVLPDGSGSITAILSAYSNSNNVTPSTYQLFIRSTDDVNLDQPRIDIVNGDGPVGGSNASYQACVSENFEDYAEDQVPLDNYINYAYNGDRYWTVKGYQGNQFYQMSSYNSGGANDVYLIVPVNFDEADEVSFASKTRYHNGEALKVFYSTDYEINGAITGLTEITSEFTISDGSSDDFVGSGVYDLSGITGNGAIFFMYQGADGGVTTTVQLDNIYVKDNDDTACEAPGDNGGGNGGGSSDEIPFTETFDGGIPASWTNVALAGDRTWMGRDYDGEFYAQNSAYSGGQILDVDAWLITPALDFDAQSGETMNLAIADAFNNGNPLKIYYSSDYTDGADPSTATWTEIGADQIAALPVNTGQYDNVYDETSIDLSALSGSNHIAFVYNSEGATISTTIQLSTVEITAN